MPDTKITALTAISTVNPATYPLPIVDTVDTTMAGSGTTKKITINQILGAGGTATLASATITGDLTVDTSTLKVDSANNRVGIGTATPAVDLHIQAAGSASAEVRLASATRSYNIGSTGSGYGSANNLIIYDLTGAAERYRLDASGNHFWNNVGGVAGTAMTLNSTGLLVGTTATGYGAAGRGLVVSGGSTSAMFGLRVGSVDAGYLIGSASRVELGGSGTTPIVINNGGDSVFVDTSRNVGVGSTPSAWTTYNVLQVRNGSIANYSPTQDFRISSNAYYASGVWKRIAAAYATQYLQDGSSGIHQWFVAATGAADSTITTFSSAAMTLDASGNLGIGVQPSAWGAGIKALQMLGSGSSFYATAGSQTLIGVNAYYDTAWKYGSTNASSYYEQTSGSHRWFSAPSGTVNTAITFTQAMTLDASGRLLVGRTSPISAETFSSNGFALIGGATHQALIGEASGNVFAGSFTNTPFRVRTNNVEVAQFDTSGNFLSYLTSTAPTLSTNGAMVFNLTSNTNLRISVRGTDGVTRTANITLA